MSETGGRSRLSYIDALRTLAVCAVVLLHCVTPYLGDAAAYGTKTWLAADILNVLSRVGVPVFFMISGYLLLSDGREEKLGDFLRRRLSRVLIPFLVWNAIYYVWWSLELKTALSVPDFLYRLVTMDIYYHFWFVYSLIMLYLLVPVLKPFVKNSSVCRLFYLLAVIIFPTTVSPLINTLCGTWLFRFEASIFGYSGYMVLGYILGTFVLPRAARAVLYVCGGLSAVISAAGIYFRSSEAGLDDFFNGGYQLNWYVLAAAVFVAMKSLLPPEKPVGGRLAGTLALAGKLSYGVYLSHAMALYLSDKYFCFSSGWADILFDLGFTLAVCFGLCFVLSRIKPLARLLL